MSLISKIGLDTLSDFFIIWGLILSSIERAEEVEFGSNVGVVD